MQAGEYICGCVCPAAHGVSCRNKNKKTFYVFPVLCYICAGEDSIAMDIRERVCGQALRMFYEMGIKSVRMDDIAAACGISKRTLYENFADREELIRQTICYHLHTIGERMQAQLESAVNPIDEFRIVVDNTAGIRAPVRGMVLDLAKFYPRVFEELVARYHEHMVEVNADRLRRGMDDGLFLKRIDALFMARSLTRYIYGLYQDWAEVIMPADVGEQELTPQAVGQAVMLFLRGIATEKGRRYLDDNILTDIAEEC